jgi:hypothetical protein
MAITNRERVGKGLELLRAGLVPFIERVLKDKLGEGFREVAQARFELRRQPGGELHWDNQAVLKQFMHPEVWREVIEPHVGRGARSFAGELVDVRNRHAHDETFTSDQAERALDTMRLLLVEVGATREADQVQELRHDLQRQVFAEMARQKTRTGTLFEGSPKAGLKPWREVVTPHQDVVSGQYVQAEFAADLHNVHHGIGGPEYTDPTEFFRRTFITEGLRELLAGALERLSGKGGDPVVELQTNFGGGKTHALLALYHLFSGTAATKLPGMEPVLQASGVERAPKAKRAVLVGTHLSVGEVSQKPKGPAVRTLWGELAWQLGGAEGYKLVAESDARGVSPGAAVLADLFRQSSPCLVLIDEWVAYARNTVDRHDLPSGDFDAQATFAQAITEAAKAADRTLVVASIPSSNIEVGGANGKHALAVLKNTFERVAKTWRPASADEGFEIVRRRLFEPIQDKDAFVARDAVLDAFSRLYAENKADFPAGAGEGAYKRKLEAAYPLHPDVFDQLYGEWSTLDKFQRTRGVLRLLAKVIHRLWESADSGLLIMPASLPMDDPALKSELTRYLDDVWEPIISEDVDGPQALPVELDRQNPNLGRFSACRRVARTLYFGTAPGSTSKNPGIDDRRVRLGCTQPGEPPATFGDALRRISDRAKHIHQDGSRYWISTKPNLNRLAEDRASAMLQEPERLHARVVERIRAEHKAKPSRGDFAGVHPCPESTAEVHDEPEARLVILGPQYPHRKGQTDTPGVKLARTLLDQRGNSPRLCRNMLVFLAADAARLDELLQGVAQHEAWRSIHDEEETLNLDSFQRRQAESRAKDTDDTVNARIKETWTLALVPSQRDPAASATTRPEDLIGLDEIRVQGTDTLARRTATKLKNDGLLVPALGGVTLRHHLDNHLWRAKNHVTVGQLGEWFARYLYLPRIVNRDTLIDAIKDGLNQLLPEDTFAFASGFDEATNRYRGLQVRATSAVIENTSVLVKTPVARKQVEEDEKPRCPSCRATEPAWQPAAHVCSKCGYASPQPDDHDSCRLAGVPPKPTPGRRLPGVEPLPPQKPNLFVGSVHLDGSRLARDAGKIAEEVLQHLSTLPDAEVVVRLEIQVRVPGGVNEDTVRTVSENARTLKFESAGFEKG